MTTKGSAAGGDLHEVQPTDGRRHHDEVGSAVKYQHEVRAEFVVSLVTGEGFDLWIGQSL